MVYTHISSQFKNKGLALEREYTSELIVIFRDYPTMPVMFIYSCPEKPSGSSMHFYSKGKVDPYEMQDGVRG